MKKYLILSITAFLLSSCVSSRMYYWGSNPAFDDGVSRYEKLAYKNYDKQTPESICELICLYEDMVNNPGGTRKVIPPGICAEYGYLLLLPSTIEYFEKYASKRQRKIFSSTDYATLFSKKGEEMLKKEMELYPESKIIIEQLLNRLK